MNSRKQNIKIWSFIMMWFWFPLVYAQEGQGIIRGTVTDNQGLGLPGVTVLLEGTTIGTTTDMDGNYILNIPQDAARRVLEFRYVGFVTIQEEIGQRTQIDVVMEEDVRTLEAFVVVGYGVQRKVDLTGSVSTVSGTELRQLPVSGVDQALQGRAAGVNVTYNTGMPGEGVNIRIRGVGSINSRNEPLYIVDGVPTVDALSTLSPNDIESISILKDAASSAIYGARANNGVILITTRKGAAGAPRVEISAQTGFQQHGRLTPMTNRDQYVEMYNEAAMNDNAFIENPRFHRELISPEFAAALPDVNHLSEIFRQGIIHNHNVAVSGGSDDLTYLFSGNFFQQEGIIIGSNYENYTGRLSINSNLNTAIRLGSNINIARSDNDIIGSSGDGFGGNGGSVVRYAFFRTPAIPVHDERGGYVDRPQQAHFFGDGYNPVGLADKMNNNIRQNRLFGDINLHWQILSPLTFSSVVGVDRTDFFHRRFNENWGTNLRINNPNSLNINNGFNQSFSASNVLSFNQEFGERHDLSLIAGTEAIRNNGYTNNANQRNFPDQNDRLVFLGNGLGAVLVSEGRWANTLLSFFGRVNYSLDNRYLLSGTLRRDGSSRFSPENRWGTFYSISGAWRIDREGFMANNTFFDMLKLRAGYGAIGNQEVGNYAYSDQISPNFNYPFAGIPSPGYAITLLGNFDLQWETSTQIDLGLDISIFDGRIYAELGAFRKITANMLVREPIPPSAGYASPAWVNNGEILNQGLELELTWRDNFGRLGLEITGNAAYLHNEVLSLAGTVIGGRIDNGVYATRTEVGYPIGSFYLYEMDGIFQNNVDIVTSAYQGVNIRPGDVRYVDQNGDGFLNELDRVHVGSAIPRYTTGLQAGFSFMNFDLAMFWHGAFGHHIYYQVATDIEGFYRPFNLTMRYYENRWTGPGTSNTQPRASWSGKSNNTRPSTRFLEDASFLRLKNLQFGYTLPAEFTARLGIGSARIYFLGHNLLTFTAYPGLDPEMTTSDNSRGEQDVAAGIDWGTYPLARSFNFGVQLNF